MLQRKISGRIKEDANASRHRYRAKYKAADFGVRPALGDALEHRGKIGGDKKQPRLGGKIYDVPRIHSPDNRRVAANPIRTGNSAEYRFVFPDDIDVYDAELISTIHSHQINEAEWITGNVNVNRT
jgi:hypothetical protein